MLLLVVLLLALLMVMSSLCRYHCGFGFTSVVVVLDVAAAHCCSRWVVIAEIVAHFANYCNMVEERELLGFASYGTPALQASSLPPRG